MELLKKRILEDGEVKTKDVLNVNSFLNHQIDVSLLKEMAMTWYEEFKECQITKILTIEASGIALATMVASVFNVPLVFAKKTKTSNMNDNVYSASVDSYTHGTTSNIVVSAKYLNSCDRVLIVDDFLALGNALKGLISLCEQAQATVCGVGIAIEKGYQGGGDELRTSGYKVSSLAIIDSMDPNGKKIIFR